MQKPARSKCRMRPYERSGLLHYDYITTYMLTCLLTISSLNLVIIKT